MTAVSIFWRNLLEDILPKGSDGVVIVLDNPCNPSCTFMIDGPEVKYLGRGDLHDLAYDKYGVGASLLDLDSFSTSKSYYAGIPIDKDFCPHSFRIYPTKTMEENYTSSLPIIMTVVTAIIFVFTACVFVGYDRVVEYRQKKVMRTATKSSAIVSSLFPNIVRDRLFENPQEEKDLKAKQDKDHAFSASTCTGVDDKISMFLLDDPHTGQNYLEAPPIADLFPETSILFADVGGFTEWSSERSPSEVFQFLETIYHSFDRIAKKRGVFKVETIGDCYVAATGLPNAQENHAIIIVRFARDCIAELNRLKGKLCEKLGEDTRKLNMRIGINSGPTTAGVLRGDKGRFQLFGDTTNTASRMESTGVLGRIQVSESTAEELRSKGKGHWLNPRETKVMAKGKGELQTYFIGGLKPTFSGSDYGGSHISYDGTTSNNSESGNDVFDAQHSSQGNVLIDNNNQSENNLSPVSEVPRKKINALEMYGGFTPKLNQDDSSVSVSVRSDDPSSNKTVEEIESVLKRRAMLYEEQDELIV